MQIMILKRFLQDKHSQHQQETNVLDFFYISIKNAMINKKNCLKFVSQNQNEPEMSFSCHY